MALFPKRDIFAVRCGLGRICFIAALVYEQILPKALRTFGEKSLNVSETMPFNILQISE